MTLERLNCSPAKMSSPSPKWPAPVFISSWQEASSMRRLAATMAVVIVGWTLAQVPTLVGYRDTFEGPQVKFRRGPSTLIVHEEAHALTQQYARSAPSSEYIKLTIEESVRELNPYVHYVYTTPRALVSED